MYLFCYRGLLISVFSSWLYPCTIFLGYLALPAITPQYLSIIAIISLLASLMLFKRLRILSDTCTASLKTAAQGYVNITGQAMILPNELGPSPEYLPPTVWLSTANHYSTDNFSLIDGNRNCIIDPDQAEIIAPLRYFHQEYYRGIHPGEDIYVMGKLTSLHSHYTDEEKRKQTLCLLADWKKDHTNMLYRFDKNGDGKIDQQELMIARAAAESVVEDNHDYEYKLATSYFIEKPDDGRP